MLFFPPTGICPGLELLFPPCKVSGTMVLETIVLFPSRESQPHFPHFFFRGAPSAVSSFGLSSRHARPHHIYCKHCLGLCSVRIPSHICGKCSLSRGMAVGRMEGRGPMVCPHPARLHQSAQLRRTFTIYTSDPPIPPPHLRWRQCDRRSTFSSLGRI